MEGQEQSGMTDQVPSNERDEAIAIANRWLDEPWADPDDDLRVVARQFQRAIERLSKPAHEREGPHCSTCACGLAPDITSRTVDLTDEQRQMLTARGVDEIPAAPEPAAGWRPIETAPKDLTPILGYVLPPRMQPSLEGPRVVRWAGEESMWSMPGISGLSCSHWMPLPKAPSQPPRDGQ